MQLLALGLNHTTAPLSIREAVAFSPEEIPGALSALRSTYARPEEGGIREALILSTCNRTEFFLAAENGDAALHSLCSFVARQKGIDLKEFLPHTYEYRQSDVARHTFRVASGLDSMVLGETQIVGQMKKAWRIARESKSLGLMLGHLFDGTFAAAKVPSKRCPSISPSDFDSRAIRQAFFIWPTICVSPSTMESRPLATRNV